jgi:hypothetical protein
MGEKLKKDLGYFDMTVQVKGGEHLDITPLKHDVMRLTVIEGFGVISINDGHRSIGPGDVIDQIADVTCFIRADEGTELVIDREYL